MGENMNGFKYFQMIVWVGLAQNGEQVRTVEWGTITVIYKMFCNGRSICVTYLVNKVVFLPYFCGYMLFNSWIQMSIGSLDVLQSANTCHHHPHVALVARISLILSRHSSLSFIALGRSSGQHPVSSHSCWMYVRAGRPAFARPCVGVHKSTSLMSSSLLLQQCPASWFV